MCEWLGVSRAGYYKWRNREPSFQESYREIVRRAVIENFERFKQRYGSPRLTAELNAQGIACCENHVAKLMAEQGLKAKNGKGFKYASQTQSKNNIAENLINRCFSSSFPNQKWVSDITYIPMKKGHVYLAVIIDLFSRKVVGWHLSNTMTIELVMTALNMAVKNRDCEPDLILHSDQGSQYRAPEYVLAQHDAGITRSMSRKGKCWDNAVVESFFSRFKVEEMYGHSYADLDEVYASVFEYIEMFYNRVRRHSANGYVSPVEYEHIYHEIHG